MNGYYGATCPLTFNDGTPAGTANNESRGISSPGAACVGAYSNTVFTPSQQAMEKVWVEGMKASIETDCKRQLLQIEDENRKKQEERKAFWKEKLNQGIYERKINRENAAFAAFENADGEICMQMKMANGSVYYSPPVLNVQRLNMIVYNTFDLSDCVAIITWDNGKNKIILSDQNLSPDGMKKALEKKGVFILTSRERKKETAGLIFSYLYSKANYILLPRSLGWNKVEADWIFASCPGETIIGIKKGGE